MFSCLWGVRAISIMTVFLFYAKVLMDSVRWLVFSFFPFPVCSIQSWCIPWVTMSRCSCKAFNVSPLLMLLIFFAHLQPIRIPRSDLWSDTSVASFSVVIVQRFNFTVCILPITYGSPTFRHFRIFRNNTCLWFQSPLFVYAMRHDNPIRLVVRHIHRILSRYNSA